MLAFSGASDGALLVSASGDKTVTVWGLDCGDCHRSLLAHGEKESSAPQLRREAQSGQEQIVFHEQVAIAARRKLRCPGDVSDLPGR